MKKLIPALLLLVSSLASVGNASAAPTGLEALPDQSVSISCAVALLDASAMFIAGDGGTDVELQELAKQSFVVHLAFRHKAGAVSGTDMVDYAKRLYALPKNSRFEETVYCREQGLSYFKSLASTAQMEIMMQEDVAFPLFMEYVQATLAAKSK